MMDWSSWLQNPETRDAALDYLKKAGELPMQALTMGNPIGAALGRKGQEVAAALPGQTFDTLKRLRDNPDWQMQEQLRGEQFYDDMGDVAGYAMTGGLGYGAAKGGAKAIGTMPGDRLMMGADGSGLPPAARRIGSNTAPMGIVNDIPLERPPVPRAQGMLAEPPALPPPTDPRVRLREAYDAKAQQMDLPVNKRVQPDPSMSYLDRDYLEPRPNTPDADIAAEYPRSPKGPDAKMAKGDRARVILENSDAIAERLAQKIRDAGGMDASTRYFYHSDGPIYRGARKAGLDEAEATAYVNDFSSYTAATSPRTQVEENVRNATSAMAKTAQGIPHREIVGPGSGGISERGYPMMTEANPPKGRPKGIHGELLDDVIAGRDISRDTNTKPSYFKDNVSGNRKAATVDTHAIRGTLMTLNEMQPGSVASFILPEHKQAYLANPATLTADMIDDSLGTQAFNKRDMQTEYPVFADVMHKVGEKLGVSPAEAQSMAWFGLGDATNLGSAPKTIADVFDERLSVTAQVLNIPIEEAARRVYRREIPLLNIAGAGAAGAGMLGAFPEQRDR